MVTMFVATSGHRQLLPNYMHLLPIDLLSLILWTCNTEFGGGGVPALCPSTSWPNHFWVTIQLPTAYFLKKTIWSFFPIKRMSPNDVTSLISWPPQHGAIVHIPIVPHPLRWRSCQVSIFCWVLFACLTFLWYDPKFPTKKESSHLELGSI